MLLLLLSVLRNYSAGHKSYKLVFSYLHLCMCYLSHTENQRYIMPARDSFDIVYSVAIIIAVNFVRETLFL